ncbi:hypothetical protein NMS_1783 [Nonlabens marinus S1-08]|uniref:Uncharacterized protein n=2 Tax=Nonlabens TaxID=363408 RepID=W8VXE6_9FLAO|nr:hypothetical protein NMS_1783 [Nonlabens marinus S1-08]
MFTILIFFAFAKANSQSDTSIAVNSPITFTKNTTRTELFDIIKSLADEHQVKAQLTAYRRSSDRINSLGFKFTDATGKVSEFETEASTGISDLCLNVSVEGSVTFFGLCSSPTVAEKIRGDTTPADLITVVSTNSSPAKVNVREQQLEVLRENAVARDRARNSLKLQNELARKETNVAVLEERQDEIVSATDMLRQQQQIAREELKQLEKETNAVKRERKQLDYNNERALAKRDSLRDQQARLQQQLEREQKELEATIQAQNIARELIAKQQQVIEEQGLKAETAENLKAYRTALLGKEGNETLKKKGFLFFAADQCSYQIYEGYTIIFDALGRILFTINKELSQSPMSGELKINGKRYTYLYQANSLMVKNQVGQAVNQYGELLYPSQEAEIQLQFNTTHEFTIEAGLSPRELLAAFMDIGTLNFEAAILRETRNAKGVLVELIFQLQGDEFVFQDPAGISSIRIELDQPQLLSRVVPASAG